jgi:hypothetical protein
MSEPQNVPTPSAEPTAAPAPTGPSAAELSMQKIRALKPTSDEPSEVEEPAEAAPEPVAPKPGKKVVNPKGDEHEQLRSLAKKLGLEVEEGKLLPSDVAKFRDWKRKQTQTLEAETSKRLQEVVEREKTASERISKADAIAKAIESADMDGLAKLAGFEDWNKLQEHYIGQHSDPNYKKMRELERWKEEQEKQRVEQEKKQQEHQKAQQRQVETQKYLQGLSQQMSKSKDPLVAALHDEPLLMQAIYRIQGENYDGQSVPPPERAIRMAAKGAGKSLHDELHGMYLKLHRAFGKQQPAAPAPAAPQKKPAPKSAPVPPSATTEASGPGNWGSRPRKDFLEYQRAKMQEAFEAEERERQSARR